MKEIKINGTELQIGERVIKLSVEEVHKLKRILLEVFPEPYPQYVPYVPYHPLPVWDDIPSQYYITEWQNTSGKRLS
jgi:hypothetical protein